MTQVVWLLITLLYLLVESHMPAASASSLVSSLAPGSPPCLRKCGRVDIPYPFGIGVECSWPGQDDFTVYCNNSYNPPRPYMGNIEIINILIRTNEIRVFTHVAYSCYNSFNTTDADRVWETWLNTTDTPFLISPTQNVFTGIGCYTQAILDGRDDSSYSSGCVTTCMSLETAAKDGDKCTGLGCCQTDIPGNLSFISVSWGANGTNPAWNYSPCSYAFVAKRKWYRFRREDLFGNKGNDSFIKRVGERVPVVLDWAISRNSNDGSCLAGVFGKHTAPACVSTNSYCENATYGRGYQCMCSKGYQGNPYVHDSDVGCIDINECSTMNRPCGPYASCKNTDGDHICKCKFNHKGDGKSEEGCNDYIVSPYVIAAIAIFAVIVLATLVILDAQRRKQRRFFDKNGGDILKNMGINIFTEGQLKKITNGYKNSIGEGAFGKVYIGITPDAQQVAVKCSTAKGEAVPQEEFVNEITFQFRISHANLVRLVGCCLETDVPRLVFEFVPRGSLYSVLHGTGKMLPLSLSVRLNIAIGSAEALAYMHSHGRHNHVHGDVKSGNILLDDNLTPKVSDFGSAKLVSVASRYSKWCVSGDMCYIDPIYIKTGRFTEKSDVYSFGVVLLELVTRKPAKDGENSLYIEFTRLRKNEGNGQKLYDKDILSGDDGLSHHHMECLDMISELAIHCLKEDLHDRPTMADVVEELKRVKAIASGGSCSVAS